MSSTQHPSIGHADLKWPGVTVPAGVLRPRPLARLRARLTAGSLDRRLAVGADPSASPVLARRAARLTSRAGRAELADGLERLVDHAEESGQGWTMRFRVPPARPAVLGHRSDLRGRAAELRRPAPLYARGLAMLSVLLTDGTGPLYAPERSGELEAQLGSVRRALVS
jgi:hypothetical protein